MKRNDSFSIDNKATKKPRALSDVAVSDKCTDSASADAAASTRIDRPGPFDVICGRGRPYQEHPGNKRLHEIAAVYKPKYLISKRRYKKGIAEMIVTSIKNDETQPGRFLKRVDDENDEVWEDVSDEVAREKVSHVLRFKCKSSDSPSEASTSESGDNQSSMLGQSQGEPLWNSRTLPAFGLPVAAGGSSASEVLLQPSHSTLNAQRAAALLNPQRPAVGTFGILGRRATGGASISDMSSGTVGTGAGAPTNVRSETSPVDLLSNEQVFLLEALIHRRRREDGTDTSGIAKAAQFPS